MFYFSADFECAVLDCPEWLGAPIPGESPGARQENCYRTYALGECCSTGGKCGKCNKIRSY